MPEEARENPADVVIIMAKSLWLAMKLLFVLMRFKRKANRAARNFRKAAVKGGMDRRMADQLTEQYVEFASIRKMVKNVTGSGKIPFMN
ncbi:MAG: hypothetical protein V1934_07295 [Methanobacteriota archaeon]